MPREPRQAAALVVVDAAADAVAEPRPHAAGAALRRAAELLSRAAEATSPVSEHAGLICTLIPICMFRPRVA